MKKKKEYIAPQIEVVEIDAMSMFAGSKPEIGVGNGDAEADDAWSNRHRGEWGNLWDSDK
jgi:hypothetical protein